MCECTRCVLVRDILLPVVVVECVADAVVAVAIVVVRTRTETLSMRMVMEHGEKG